MPVPDGARRVAGRMAALALVALVTLLAVLSAREGPRSVRPVGERSAAWEGLVPAPEGVVDPGQRMIVVLRLPSLASRVAAAGGVAGDVEERRWTRRALTDQRLLISRLGLQGARIRPEFHFTRVLNAFSAALDPRAVALLERAPEVAGIYRVRPAYPAATGGTALPAGALAGGAGPASGVALPGFDGRGVTVALLDTGVDRSHPYLRGRVADGVDVLSRVQGLPADPHAEPGGGELERHGTELAGIVAGANGPGGARGVAPGATLFPVRVAGWQRSTRGGWEVASRTDQLIAGLERAVDPNGDGDAHDGARIALVGVVEPLAGFADGPLARAAAGAHALDMLVVAPGGNNGESGPGFGVVSAPGGAPAALTVGAADERSALPRARVVLRTGLDVVLDSVLPLAGAVPPRGTVDLPVAQPEIVGDDVEAGDFLDHAGYSLVAGKAALVPAAADAARVAREAAQAGAAAVVLYGSRVPAGGLGLDERTPVPVVAVPAAAAARLVAAARGGASVRLALGGGASAAGGGTGRVAPFSSRGLAFDGRVKPELVAPGVGVPTSEPGTGADDVGSFGTVNGSSAAAAVTAGAAALLAHARPDLDADALKALLVGTARRLPRTPLPAQGAGALDIRAAVTGELGAVPAALAFGRPLRKGWAATRVLTVRNLSSRTVRARVRLRQTGFPAAEARFGYRPRRLILPPGAVARIRVEASIPEPAPGGPPVAGEILLAPSGGRVQHVPFAIPFAPVGTPVLEDVRLAPGRFTPSETSPAVLSLRAGSIRSTAAGEELQPVERLDVELWTSDDHLIGVVARVRDLLPGLYTFAVTGHDPGGQALKPGEYRLRLVAFPSGGGPPTRRSVRFSID